MEKNIMAIVAVIAVVVIAIGGYFAYQAMNAPKTPVVTNQQTASVPAAPQESIETQTQPTEVQGPVTLQVLYTDSGFSPSKLTIKKGDTIIFKNESTHGMWVGSAMHPGHTAYSGTTLKQHCPDTQNDAFDECQSDPAGTSWSFTFNKTGTWGYHNHMKATDFGQIIVE